VQPNSMPATLSPPRNPDAERRTLELAIAGFRREGRSTELAESAYRLGDLLRWEFGELMPAWLLMQEALVAATATGAPVWAGLAQVGLAAMSIDLGELEAARRHLDEALACIADRPELAPELLQTCAVQAAVAGAAFRALRLMGAAAQQAERQGLPSRPAAVRTWVNGHLQRAGERLSDDSASTEWLQGRGMSLEQALAYASATAGEI